MDISLDYKKNVNYIGNAEWQYKITDTFYKSCSGINYTAYWHDILYGQLLWKEKFIVNKILLKILIDLIFLVMGFFRSLTSGQIRGMIIVVGLYLALLVSTLWYFIPKKKHKVYKL